MRLSASLVLAVALISIAAADAKASDPIQKEKSSGAETRPRRAMPEPAAAEAGDSQQQSLQIAYVVYDRAIRPAAEQSIPLKEEVQSNAAFAPSASILGARTAGAPIPQKSAGVISTAPMTPGEKFEYWFHRSILSPGAYGSAVFGGLYKELLDNDDNKKDTVGNYFADSMTRAARSFAFSTTAGFFEKGVFPTIFRQDPRYHRSGKKGAGARIGYAVTRVFVTQGDRCGCHQFNASFILGGAAATGIANLWERRERTGPMHNVRRFYTHIYLTALFNVVKEFVQGQ